MSKTKSQPTKASTRGKASRLGEEIIESLTELAEVLESGRSDLDHFTAHTVEMPDEPAAYDARAVRQTRERVRASQSVFARLLGVSVMLVQAWERGARLPAPWARRLLDEVNRDPQHWRGMLMAKAG